MKAFWILIIVILFIFIAGVMYMHFGLYDVSASRKESTVQSWILSDTMKSSVKRQAKGINVPDLQDSNLIAIGLEHYGEMCITCHGAPGELRSEIGRGLNPEAPDLPKTSIKWSDAELFWIIKNGIKMTGMPAFGITHSDDKIWAIVSFVRRLEKLTPEEYHNLTKAKIE
jgi:mono/diheme cytochrome c family protein